MTDDQTVLEVNDLKTRFHTRDCTIFAVNGVSFSLKKGESVTARSLLGLIPVPPGEIASGSAVFEGQDLISLENDEIRRIRGSKIGFIFQDPMTSLNPVLTIGQQIMEPMETHLGLSSKEAKKKTIELLHSIGFPSTEARLRDYPHQFSGGMRQRVMIAIALSCNPKVLIADEPTTALDVTIQAQLVAVIKNIRKEYNMSVVWITHNLGLVAGIADRVMVMYGGRIVERAPVVEIFHDPRHPYTQGLLGSLPRLGRRKAERLISIKGHPPRLVCEPLGCPFAPRCPHAFEKCCEENPALHSVAPSHDVACWWDIEKGEPRSAF